MEEILNPKVLGTFSGSSTTVYTCPKASRSFAIVNDSTTTGLTFTINGITISVGASEMFDDTFAEFTSVIITITGSAAFRAVVRGF